MSETIACRLCGRDFVPQWAGVQAYCTSCRNRAAKKAAKKHRLRCKECGKSFTSASLAVRYCSDPCRKNGYRTSTDLVNNRHPAHGEIVACRVCGKAFKAERGRGKLRVHCSEKCRAEGRRIRNREDMRKYLADPERRAVQRARMNAIVIRRRAEKKGRGGQPSTQGTSSRRPS